MSLSNNSEQTVRLTFEVPLHVRQALKAKAALANLNMRDIMGILVSTYIDDTIDIQLYLERTAEPVSDHDRVKRFLYTITIFNII